MTTRHCAAVLASYDATFAAALATSTRDVDERVASEHVPPEPQVLGVQVRGHMHLIFSPSDAWPQYCFSCEQLAYQDSESPTAPWARHSVTTLKPRSETRDTPRDECTT